MLRICASPICPAASASIGAWRRITSELATAACVVVAPIRSAPACSRMPASSGTRRMSMRCAGWANRSFMTGRRLCPPAISLPSSAYCASSETASSTLSARWYSKDAGYMVRSPPLGRRLHGLPNLRRRQRHVDVCDPERTQRVHHRVRDCWRRRDRTSLAHALGAEWVDRRRRDRAIELEERQLVRLRDAVVHKRTGNELAAVVILGALPQRLCDALCDPAVQLAVHDHWVDDIADVVHRDVA